MDIIESTKTYEDFIRKYIPLLDDDLELKHKEMTKDRFRFLRATYYRWAQKFPEILPELVKAPEVFAIGDLHLENFGTFLNMKKQLVWAVNDFDEVDVLPYTNDLVRLATSALLAIHESKLKIKPKKACRAILDGYQDSLQSGGCEFVIKGKNHFLRKIYRELSVDPKPWWKKLASLSDYDSKLEQDALELLNQVFSGMPKVSLHRRIAGLGSLGHRRVVATSTKKNKKPVAYELKELGPSATVLFQETPRHDIYLKNLRSEDPSRLVEGNWLIRRLAPDCTKLELSEITSQRKELHLLHDMGSATANIHIQSKNAISKILQDTKTRREDWLYDAASNMSEVIKSDWNVWSSQSR